MITEEQILDALRQVIDPIWLALKKIPYPDALREVVEAIKSPKARR